MAQALLQNASHKGSQIVGKQDFRSSPDIRPGAERDYNLEQGLGHQPVGCVKTTSADWVQLIKSKRLKMICITNTLRQTTEPF